MDAILPGVLVREKLCYIVSTFGKTFGPLPTTHVQLLSSFYHFTCIFDIPLTCETLSLNKAGGTDATATTQTFQLRDVVVVERKGSRHIVLRTPDSEQ